MSQTSSSSWTTIYGSRASRERLALVWVAILASYAALVSVLHHLMWEAIPAWLVAPLIVLGCTCLPLHLLTIVNSGFIAFNYLFSEEDVCDKGTRVATFVVAFGCASGTALIISSKFTPISLQKRITGVALPLMKIYRPFVDRFPEQVLAALGFVFTLVSEFLFISPLAVSMLIMTAQLKYAGEDFDRSPEEAKTDKKKTVIVLIHGNGFNECQWLYPRFLFRTQPWFNDVELMTVNIFRGFSMRSHHERTKTIAGCADVAFEEIQHHVKRKAMEPEKVILIGHSLGALVSAHLQEYYRDRLPIKHVVAWSGPFGGSALFAWGQRMKIVSARNGTIRDEFCPTSENLMELRRRMKQGMETHVSSYYAISGHCDHLVRPDSAVLDFIPKHRQKLIPYVGHFNIKVSLNAWGAVLDQLDEHILVSVTKTK